MYFETYKSEILQLKAAKDERAQIEMEIEKLQSSSGGSGER